MTARSFVLALVFVAFVSSSFVVSRPVDEFDLLADSMIEEVAVEYMPKRIPGVHKDFFLGETEAEPESSDHMPDFPPMSYYDPSDNCQICTSYTLEAYTASQNKSEMAIVLSELQGLCALNASTALLCDIIVGALVKEIPKLPEKLFHSGFYTPTILCSALSMCSVDCCSKTGNQPSQIHLSVAGAGEMSPTQMTVTWVTQDDTADVNVRYGYIDGQFDQAAVGSTRTYTQLGWVGSVHVATMTKLLPNMKYYYQVGGPNSGWSSTRSFTTIDDVLPANFTFAIYGDMGAERNYSASNQDWINYAATAAPPQDSINMVVHVGDVGYADGYEERWDLLFTEMEPAASSLPYMTSRLSKTSDTSTLYVHEDPLLTLVFFCFVCFPSLSVPGNHEVPFNFTSYKTRLEMPNFASGAASDAMYYSWDTGCIHWVAMNSESPLNTPEIDDQQIGWLKADLAAFDARRKAGQKLRASGKIGGDSCSYQAPTFLIVYMHRPMYCSNNNKQGQTRCGKEGPYLMTRVEDIFRQYAVDVVYSGHIHAYELTTNVYKGQVDPSGPIYIMNGAGGNREGQNNAWSDPAPSWVVHSEGLAGLGHLTMVNSTTLNWRWFTQTDLGSALESNTSPTPVSQQFIHARI